MIVKDTNIDLLNFIPALKSVPKIKKSPKRKPLEIKMFHRELLKELKWKCSVLKAKIDKLSGNDMTDSHFKAVNFVAAIKSRLETLELQQKYNALEESLKTEYAKIFECIPHVDKLPNDVYCRIKLRDATKTISKRTYGCPRKYCEAWKTLIDRHIDSGQIRLLNSSFASASFIIPKTDPTMLPRWVNDYRELI